MPSTSSYRTPPYKVIDSRCYRKEMVGGKNSRREHAKAWKLEPRLQTRKSIHALVSLVGQLKTVGSWKCRIGASWWKSRPHYLQVFENGAKNSSSTLSSHTMYLGKLARVQIIHPQRPNRPRPGATTNHPPQSFNLISVPLALQSGWRAGHLMFRTQTRVMRRLS